MSQTLLKKSLALCDPDLEQFTSDKIKKNSKKKSFKPRVTRIDKHSKIESDKKISVKEARNKLKEKEQILKDNLQRIKLSKKTRQVKLNNSLKQQLIERAITRKPVKPKTEKQKEQPTLFTDEDFKKFEAEYTDY